MRLSQLPSPRGATHRRKRVGCGLGSGHGKTATRGHKGSQARSGKEISPDFEGGQTRLYRRLPKRGFRNPFRTTYAVVNLARLEALAAPEVTPELLAARGLVRADARVKILGTGTVSRALTVKAHAFSKAARAAIEAAGGTVEVL